MPTPVKEITYLTGIFPKAKTPEGEILTVKARMAVVMRLLPAFWKPISIKSAVTLARAPYREVLFTVAGYRYVKMTLFWRYLLKRPKRGQLWPRTR